MDVHQGPVLLATVSHEQDGQVTHGGQGRLQGVIAAGPGPRPTGSVLGPHARGVEVRDGLPQRLRDGLRRRRRFTAPFCLVGGQGEPAESEEVLERAGEGAHRPSGPAGSLEQCQGRVGVLVLQEPPQVGDEPAGSGDTTAGRDLDDEGAAGVLLPAGRAHPQSGMASQLPALTADPWWVFRRSGMGTGPAPAGFIA